MDDELVLCVGTDGTIEGLYHDEVDLRVLGPVEVRRASRVEFDETRAEWVAEGVDGMFIARSARRRECLRREVAHFQDRFRRGFRPFAATG